MFDVITSPAEQLSGLVLKDGWTVGEPIAPSGRSGGRFSIHYNVTNSDGTRAFLKALDVRSLFGDLTVDFAEKMKELGTLYTFERDMLNKCEHMTRVVTSLSHGQAIVPNSLLGPVPYFIFDMASGDVRAGLATLGPKADVAWKLRSLHQVTVGLEQMHRRFLAHQDVKPANILVFTDGCRVGDLGRVSERGVACPHDGEASAGESLYSPPEIRYGYLAPEWETRRFGCDLYLLGSMVVYLFTQLTVNVLLYQDLEESFHWLHWGGDYKTVVPYLQDGFVTALEEFQRHIPDAALASELRTVVAELCNPDVDLRGLPPVRRRGRSRFSLEQYISKFNLLARHAELRLKL